MMGFSYSQDEGPAGAKMCFNGANMWQLGWTNNDQLLVDEAYFNTDQKVILLDGLTKAENSGGEKVIRFKSGSSAADLYLVFNWQNTYNAGTREAANQVTIVEKATDGYRESVLVARLSASGTYTKAGFFTANSRDLTIAVNSIDTTTGRATITATIQSFEIVPVSFYPRNHVE